jgi:hypothetical protein
MAQTRLQSIAELEKGMTPKQVQLARALAQDMGISKTEAYRRIYGYKGKSKAAINVEATRAAQNPKVSLLATALREGETARWWKDKSKLQNYVLEGFLKEAEESESSLVRMKALELVGRTRFASVFEEPAANEANAAVAGSLVDLIGARLQSLLGVATPTLGDGETVDTTFDPVAPDATTPTETPTGGGEGD